MRLNEALRQVSYIVCSPALYKVYATVDAFWILDELF